MDQSTLHIKTNLSTPPQGNLDASKLPIVIKLSVSYKQWHEYLIALPRHTRFTIGSKIDSLFADCLELSLMAGYAPRDKKSEVARRLSVKFDALKFFLKLLWEIKGLDNRKYTTLSPHLNEIGKMIGGWMKMLG
ncbi:MAG: four helix bundle protein [Patescibacteria group bacterium]|nr:four helix bundle protein [Patescibacteria group bacterium]